MDVQSQPAWFVAVMAGLASFVSPCVLPLIPGYLSMISGLSVEQLEQRRAGHLPRILLSCILFSMGFSVVFILAGIGVGMAGRWLQDHARAVNIVFGLVVLFFGLFVMGVVKLPFLYQDRRLRMSRGSLGLWSAPFLGFAFGFGWTPCVGPWLSGLIAVAMGQTPVASALLFAIFSATLATCFTLAGVLFARALRTFTFLQRNYRTIELVSGGILCLIGVLLVAQQWTRAIGYFNAAVSRLTHLAG
jgi:cytochrome c-type biogenesis protein